MDASTARSTRRARGSDHGLRPLMRAGDAIAGSGWEPRGVNANTKRPDPSATASGRPLRVLLTTDWWEPVVNGVVASVRTLRRELLALGCDVRVLTLSQGLRTRNEEGVYRLGSVSASMVYDRARIGMPSGRRVLREILRWSPDVVHSQAEFSTYVWARRIARMLSVPLVHTYHTIYEDYTHYYSPSRTMGRKVVESFSRRVLSRTDAVIVPTAKVARLLTGYRVDRPLHVIPTGLDLERFRPARTAGERADARALRAGLGNRPDARVLVVALRRGKEQDHDVGVQLIAVADPQDHVRVPVREGAYRGEPEARAGVPGITDRVRFTGI